MTVQATEAPLRPEAIPGVWRGNRARLLAPTEKTGFKVLDEALTGGWPRGSLTEIVSRYKGYGFSMAIPLMARLTQEGKFVALVNTPHLPYAPALDSRGVDLGRLLWIQPAEEKAALWTVEQLLQSGHVAGIAFWTRDELDGNTERRLQLAGEASRCVIFAFRGGAADGQSYAALKIGIAPAADGQVAIDILKCRGGLAGRRVVDRFRPSRPGRVSA